jgi:putative tricarboxylic transport membrane protein
MNAVSEPKMYRRGAFMFPLLLVAAGGYTVSECPGYGLGSILKPGAGLWPFLMGCFLVVCGAVLLAKAKKESPSGSERPSRSDYLDIGAITLTFLIWGVVGEHLGWLFSTFLLALTITKIFGFKGILKPVCQSVLITAVCYVLFGILITIDLPPTLPEFLLR